MSTFYGGEQLIQVLPKRKATGSTTAASYTCPSGHYAEVFIMVNNISVTGLRVNYTGVPLAGSIAAVPQEEPNKPSFILDVGDSITGSASLGDEYNYQVREYKLP